MSAMNMGYLPIKTTVRLGDVYAEYVGDGFVDFAVEHLGADRADFEVGHGEAIRSGSGVPVEYYGSEAQAAIYRLALLAFAAGVDWQRA